METNAPTPVNLDFDARVPIPFSVFPSSYRSDAATEKVQVKVEETQILRDGREDQKVRYSEYSATGPGRNRARFDEEVRIYEEDKFRGPSSREEVHVSERDRYPRERSVEAAFSRERYREPYRCYAETQIDVDDKTYDRDYSTTRRAEAYGESNVDLKGGAAQDFVRRPAQIREEVRVESRTTVDPPRDNRFSMGYYDDEGRYHSFRQGLHNIADRIVHPIHGSSHHHHREREENIVVGEEKMSGPRPRESTRYTERSAYANTITIPCHHIRIGDLLILQGRPCQVIRITTSAQTGQHRYLGVDLFTKQLHEESSFISNPAPSVVVQNMLGPVFKQYRVLDIRDDGRVVAMAETGDIKQGLPVVDQSALSERLIDAFDGGRGSVRVLVINDDGRELVVDYKVVHGSRL